MALNPKGDEFEKKYETLEAETTACKKPDDALPLYRALIENAGEAILVSRDDGFVFVNPKAEALLGCSQKELAAKSLTDFIHAEDRPAVGRLHEMALADGKGDSPPLCRIVDRQGDVKWVRLRVLHFGDVVEPATFIFMTDLTSRKRAEDELRRSQEKYRRVIDTTAGGYLLLDPSFFIVDVNKSLLHMLNCERDDLVGRQPELLYDRQTVQFYSANRDHISFEAKFQVKNGRAIPLLYNRNVLRDDSGAITGYVAFLSDLTELKLVQERLQRAEERYRRMYINAVQGMFQSALSGRILRANPSCARILGYDSVQELLSLSNDSSILFFDPDDRKRMLDELKAGGVLANYELKFKRKDDLPVWLLFNIRLTEGDGGETIIEGIVVDNTAKKLAEEELRKSEENFRRLSIHDNLTGLFNTRHMYKALADLIAESEASGLPFSLIFMDMDNFKIVVDTYGHLNGSRALQEAAATVQSTLIEPAFGVAYGGDEFVVVLPGFDKAGALKKAEEIRARMRETIYLAEQGYKVHLSASFGVATFPEDAADRDALLALADKAMFAIKKRGKNAVGVSPSAE